MSDKVPIGRLAEPGAGRDAIHVAVFPATAYEDLKPGEHVGLIGLPGNVSLVGVVATPVGIVDPFLAEPVKKGQRFYVCLYPNTVTSLRHHWTHPAIPGGGAS